MADVSNEEPGAGGTEPSTEATVQNVNAMKVMEEIRNLKLQNEKLEEEKLEKKWLKWIKDSTGVATFIVALAAFVSATWSIGQGVLLIQKEGKKETETAFRALVQNFGDKSAAVRTSAAVSISDFITQDGYRQRAIGLLVYNLGIEQEYSTRQAIVASLSFARNDPVLKKAALELIAERRREIIRELGIKFGREPLVRSGEKDGGQQGAVISTLQEGLLALARALAVIQNKPLDLRCALFKGFSLIEADLRGAVFDGAVLWGTDFWGANLQRAQFRNAVLKGADFTRADVKAAEFFGSNIEGANFTHAINIEPDKLKDTNWRRAKFADASKMVMEKHYSADQGYEVAGKQRTAICPPAD